MRALPLRKLNLKRQINKIKFVSGAVQDEVTKQLIDCVKQIQKESGSVKALATAELFLKVVHLYDDGVPMTAALLAISEFNNERKNAAKILGLVALCIASAVPSLIINQEDFEDYVEDLRDDAQSERPRVYKKRTSNVTSIKKRTKRTK